MTSTPGTDVAVFDVSTSKFPALFADQEGGDAEIAELMADNLGEDGIQMGDLPRLHVPSGGGRVWELPGGDDEDAVAVAFVAGVIIHKQKTRSMWFKQMGGGEENGPPDCGSDDAVLGNPGGAFGVGSAQHPTGDCESCPMNAWGSARPVDGVAQKGKGCKEQLQLWILQEGAILPTQISLPPTSLKAWRLFVTQLLAANQSVHQVVTKFALKALEANGNKYSAVSPSVVRVLDKAERVGAKRFGATIKGRLEAQAQARRDAAEVEANASDAGAGADVWRSDAVPDDAKVARARKA